MVVIKVECVEFWRERMREEKADAIVSSGSPEERIAWSRGAEVSLEVGRLVGSKVTSSPGRLEDHCSLAASAALAAIVDRLAERASCDIRNEDFGVLSSTIFKLSSPSAIASRIARLRSTSSAFCRICGLELTVISTYPLLSSSATVLEMYAFWACLSSPCSCTS